MNSKVKRRMGVVTGIIVIVLILVLAFVGGNSAARTVSVAEAIELQDDSKIQVTGNVVENSFEIEGDVLTFEIYDPESDPGATASLDVRYDGGVSATFGNEVTAICTGKKNSDGVLNCSELVTKCPSKYESGHDALGVADLLGYGTSVIDKTVKVAGTVSGAPSDVGAEYRFVLTDTTGPENFRVLYGGALSDDIKEGSFVVLTGSLGSYGAFTATNVALEG